MPLPIEPVFGECVIDELTIEDEPSFRHVALYADLKQVLRDSAYPFRILPHSLAGRWDRAQLLNLCCWEAGAGGDVLVDRNLPADVVAHAAWHHLAGRALGIAPGTPPAAHALFLGEAIASAFDLYLVGRLLGQSPDSSFLESQVPAMADACEAAGLAPAGFEALLAEVARDPERAFADLRELLSDATAALFASDSAASALAALASFDAHRFASLLHHYELSNWVLYARAFARTTPEPDARAEAVDIAMREAPVALDWLVAEWVEPALRGGARPA